MHTRSTRVLALSVALVLSACASGTRTVNTPLLTPEPPPRFNVLVFSKTAGYRHASIPAGIQALQVLGTREDFSVDATEDASWFVLDTLAQYEAVVFLSTTLDVLDETQQSAFESYIQGGGGFVGIHAAADTEYDWDWYGGLVGGYFDSHPETQSAEVHVVDRTHGSTKHLPRRWSRVDEWYNYKANPRANVHVLAKVSEKSYTGGGMGFDHPIAWAHAYDGGRSWYTGMGHTEESYTDPLFVQHLLGGIEWAAGAAKGDVGVTQADHFQKEMLSGPLTDPMELAIAEDGRVFLVERAGMIKLWNPETQRIEVVGYLPVHMVIEDGLLGITLDPNFSENNWIYVFYAPEGGAASRLSRFTVPNNRLDHASEKILLEVEVQREVCCHAGGSLTFDPQGNLYLSTGDNSDPNQHGSPMDERVEGKYADAQRSSANTNDLRGKILRIRPQPDGTYTIPEGNLFPADSLHRPEIYTMGHRNPFRISIDPSNGWLYWGDVGNGDPPNERGGWGWDEFNQARQAGFFGWPHFSGPNQAYKDYDYATETIGAPFDPAAPVNDSPHNTGAQVLPPAQPALMWYTYGQSDEFPELGAGGINPMAGPVYRPKHSTLGGLPDYYAGKWIIYEWMRNWVQVVTFDTDGGVLDISPFLPGMAFVRPMDMELGPEGDLYILEWGDTFWGSNPNAQLVRIRYKGEAGHPLITEVEPTPPSPSNATIHFNWPVDGGIFDFESPIPYAVVQGEGKGEIQVTPYTGFDTAALPLPAQTGTEGSVEITRDYTHTPDLHFINRFAQIEAMSRDSAGVEVRKRITLHPRQKEAEHTTLTIGATRKNYGMHPASKPYAATSMSVLQVKPGDIWSYAPVNFANIDGLTLRVRILQPGVISLRYDAPDGPELARFDLQNHTDRQDNLVQPQRQAVAHIQSMTKHVLVEGLDPEVYEGWTDLKVNITDPGGPRKIVFVAEGEGKKYIAEVDWMQFHGDGVHRQNAARSTPKEPIKLRLGTAGNTLEFDNKTLEVETGRAVELTLTNRGSMPHNILIGIPGSLEKIGTEADLLLANGTGEKLQYIPAISEVLFSSELVGPFNETTLRFTAPSRPGRYPFVCTFPGHWRTMNGVLVVRTPAKVSP